MQKIMLLLGIDYGTKRIGVAISSEEGGMAFPLAVLVNDGSVLEKLKMLCDERKIDAIVIGESRDLSGKPNPLMKNITAFKLLLENETNLPVYLEPEFFTSAEAERLQGKGALHDASAAALILKSYLNRQQ